MSAHLLEDLFTRLGEPAWYWPAVLAVVLALVLLGAMEGGAP